ncbi:MLO-like protein 6 [Nymphaea thermarum]|nr:MLO-like protein 6 [Nymphaea thermarum]
MEGRSLAETSTWAFSAVFAVLIAVSVLIEHASQIATRYLWRRRKKALIKALQKIKEDPRRFRLTRQTSFGQRHLKFWSNHPLLLWPVAFFRQFFEGVSKADYFTLRHGFITAHHLTGGSSFDFHMYLARALDEDFEALVLVVGTKLQVIITKMCVRSHQKSEVVGGSLLVKPDDKLFWFGHPQFLLYLIHFILFQIEFGTNSCLHEKDISNVLKIVLGVAVQFISGYVTLPLYALVTQMGSRLREAVFPERVARGLRNWHERARKNVKKTKVSPSNSLSPSLSPRYLLTATNSLASDYRTMPSASSTPDFVKIDVPNLEIAEVEGPQVAATDCPTNESTYNGEISFGVQPQQADA